MAELNEPMRRGWTEGASGWIENERVVDHAFAPVTSAIVTAAALDGAARLLDVGCGSGMLLAEATGRGSAVGDISPTMGEAEWEGVLDELHDDIRGALVDGVVKIPGAVWLITARA